MIEPLIARFGQLAQGIRQRAWRARSRWRRARERPTLRPFPTVGIDAGSWAAALLAPQFHLVDPSSERPTDIVVDTSPPPFIQPLAMNPSRRRVPAGRGLPADVARLAADARREVDARRPTRGLRSSAGTEWLDATAVAHGPYRRAHERSATHLVNEELLRCGLAPVELDHGVTVVCATNRPTQLEWVIENFERQRYRPRRLIVVTNSSLFDRAAVEQRIGAVQHATVLHLDEDQSLGACLNAAMEHTDSRFVAKFDDDDRYGAEYLGDMLLAHRYAAAAVVGKHSHHAFLADTERVYLRFPGREFEYTSWVAGGTLVIDRERTGDLRFHDISIGEDAAFLADCQRLGHSVFAADRFHYVQYRTGANTWTQPHHQYVRKAVELHTELAGDTIEP